MASKVSNRSIRVGDLLQQELAMLIARKLRDPRLGMVTISAVDVSPDLRNAKVFFTLMKQNEDADQSMSILNKAAGFLRHEVARAVDLRVVPQLHFVFDETVQRGQRIEALLQQALHASGSREE